MLYLVSFEGEETRPMVITKSCSYPIVVTLVIIKQLVKLINPAEGQESPVYLKNVFYGFDL